MIKALVELDQTRDLLRAQMEDRDMERATTSEENARQQGITLELAKKRWARRQSRRAWEQRCNMRAIPPGPWSQDLDDYHAEEGYTIDLGDGYVGRLARSANATFNGYVSVPDGHPCIGLSYSMFDQDGCTDIPSPPLEMTYGAGKEFGYDHCHSWDLMPCDRGNMHRYSAGNYYDRMSFRPYEGECAYITYPKAVAELKKVGEYFKTLERDHWEHIVQWRCEKGRRPLNLAAMEERRRQLSAGSASAEPASEAAASEAAAAAALPAGVKRSWAAVVRNQ